MSIERSRTPTTAFTLIELLVVISIIGILIAVLLPSINNIRKKASNTQATSQLGALDQGIEMYVGESIIGGAYPPSAGDDPDLSKRWMISDPLTVAAAEPNTVISGAHLLLHAMVGADLLGTPGFRDLNRNGSWSDDTHAGPEGAYELDNTTGEEKQSRYGGAGYVSDKMKESGISSLGEMENTGEIEVWSDGVAQSATRRQRLFVDTWGRPILYYKANRAARRITAATDKPGIYWQEDNAIITGSVNGSTTYDGLDFGAGTVDNTTFYHRIADALSPEPLDDITANDAYDNAFARFIRDPLVKGRNTPVRKDTYLLISAGNDGIYGNEDDVTNWTRRKE